MEFLEGEGEGRGGGGVYSMADTTCRLAMGLAAMIHSGLSYPFCVDVSLTLIKR